MNYVTHLYALYNRINLKSFNDYAMEIIHEGLLEGLGGGGASAQDEELTAE